jgi:hypothetical protein
MISTVDPDSRHAHKSRHKRQDGFKAHLVVEPDTGLITATRLTKTNGTANSDSTVGADLLGTDTTIDAAPGSPGGDPGGSPGGAIEVLGDSAYGTGDMLAALERAGHAPVIKPWPLRPAIEGGFTIDDFGYDAEAGTLTCPNGVTRTLTKARNAVFGVACRDCSLRDKCTTAKDGRTVHVQEHESLQRAHRTRAQDDEFQATYRAHRPMVERSIAWLTRGNRRVPFRGVTKNNDWLHHRVAAVNLRRLLTMGLTHRDGTWQLA